MSYTPIDLSVFPQDREAGLRYRMFDQMYYRPNLWEHSWRLLWIIEELWPQTSDFLGIDPEKARIMALVHDDAELLTGDYQAGHKARMTSEELQAIEDEELRAVDELAARYPKEVHGYEYRTLLKEMVHKDTPESQLVGLADKLDARCESFHELFAGNFPFVACTAFYLSTLHRIGEKLPLLSEFVKAAPHELLRETGALPPDGNMGPEEFALYNKPHTQESVRGISYFPFYDAWRKLVIERGGEEGMRWLTERRE